MPDHEFVNAPAAQCAVRRTGFGERFVRYRGKSYALMGLYWVRHGGGRPRLFFVLRSIDAGTRAPALLSSCRYAAGLRLARSLRPVVHGVLIAALASALPFLGTGPARAPAITGPAERGVADPSGRAHAARRDGAGRAAASRPGEGHASVSAGGRPEYRRQPAPHGQTPRGAAVVFGTRWYAVSFGGFEDRGEADRVARLVRTKGYHAAVLTRPDGLMVYGHRYASRAKADHMAEILRMIGLPASVQPVTS